MLLLLSDMNANLHAGCSRRAAACVCFNESTFCPVYTRAITITFYLINKNLFTFAMQRERLHVKLLEINWSKNNAAATFIPHCPPVIGDVHCEFSLAVPISYLPGVCKANESSAPAHSGQFSSRASPQLLIIVYFGK
jgi:hypothetical protein